MNVLVTGGRGFPGTHVYAALREAGHETAPPGRTDGDLGETGRIVDDDARLVLQEAA